MAINVAGKEAKDKEKAAQSLAVPRLSVCADAQKVDRAKLAQTEVTFLLVRIKYNQIINILFLLYQSLSVTVYCR